MEIPQRQQQIPRQGIRPAAGLVGLFIQAELPDPGEEDVHLALFQVVENKHPFADTQSLTEIKSHLDKSLL